MDKYDGIDIAHIPYLDEILEFSKEQYEYIKGRTMNDRIAKLEVKRARLHQYIIDKLEERDYHAVADAAMDLRELEVAVNMLKDEFARKIDEASAKVISKIPGQYLGSGA